MKPKSVIVGLCGSSGSGKTLTCKMLVQELHSRSVACSGFISPAVFHEKAKIGINVMWLESAEEQLLMTPIADVSQFSIGKWQVLPEAFEWVNRNLAEIKDGRVFFCDEIGPLEVLEGKGWVKALDVVDTRRFDLNVVTFRPSLREYFSQRYPEMTIYDLEKDGAKDLVIKEVKLLFGIE